MAGEKAERGTSIRAGFWQTPLTLGANKLQRVWTGIKGHWKTQRDLWLKKKLRRGRTMIYRPKVNCTHAKRRRGKRLGRVSQSRKIAFSKHRFSASRREKKKRRGWDESHFPPDSLLIETGANRGKKRLAMMSAQTNTGESGDFSRQTYSVLREFVRWNWILRGALRFIIFRFFDATSFVKGKRGWNFKENFFEVFVFETREKAFEMELIDFALERNWKLSTFQLRFFFRE